MEEHKNHPAVQQPAPVMQTPAHTEHHGDKSRFLSVLVGITLIISLLSLYGVYSLHNKINTITGNVIDNGDGGDVVVPDDGGDEPTGKVDVTVGDNPAEGDKNAPVTIVEFSDFQCPYCGRFYSQTYTQIREQYIKTGKVKVYFRNFPLSFHENAQKAAEAVECAGEQGKFWEMHDKLFENQDKLDVASLKQYAKDLKLDTTKFNTCLDSGKMASKVQKDFSDGSSFGVSGTPSFFINGKLLVGAQPFSAFQQEIEAALKEAA